MKHALQLASGFLILILMNSCGNEVGRYQMAITPPLEGETKYYDPAVIVCDTKTGQVWTHISTDKAQALWNPKNGTVTIENIEVIKPTEKP